MKQKRLKNGRFAPSTCGYGLSEKGYPRYWKRGLLRGKYVHRVKMAEYLGRELKKYEDVHHKIDPHKGIADKLDFSKQNLEVLGHREHGFVSSKQHYFVGKLMEARENKRWIEAFGPESVLAQSSTA